jgi:MFS family permease
MATALGVRFWKFWTTTVASSMGDGLYRVMLPLLAVSYTRNPVLVSLVSVCLYFPWLLFALPVGAYADRLDRRQLIVLAQGVRFLALILFAVAAALGLANIVLLCGLAVILGTGELLFSGSAVAMLPMVVEQSELPRANSRLFAVRQLAESFIGQAGGGLLISLAVVAAVSTTAAFYAVAVIAILLIAGRFRPERPERATTIRQDIAEGVRFLASHKVLRTLALVGGGLNFASTAFNSVFVLYVVGKHSAMGLPDWAYGLLLTASAVGATVGSLLAAKAQRRFGRTKVIAVALCTPIIAQAVPAATAMVVLVAAAFIIYGTGIAMWNVIQVTLRQRIVPNELLGRVNSCITLLSWGTIPIGALMGGALASWIGLRGMFAVAAVISAFLLLGLRVITEKNIAAEEDAAVRTAVA